MTRIYEPLAYAATSDLDTFWRTTCDDTCAEYPQVTDSMTCDVAVIGAGFTGLSAALHLAKDCDVAILDEHTPGWGASGRNGGFVCVGSAKATDAALIHRFGTDAFVEFHNAQRNAIDMVADLISRHRIGADIHSDGEIQLAHRPSEMKILSDEVTFLRDTLGEYATLIPPEALADHGMSGTGFFGAIHRPLGFAINPRKYVLGLAAAARDAGVRIFGNSAVTRITPDGSGGHLLQTATGAMRAKTLIVATNGYSSETVPDWMRARYLPVQSAVMVTRPLSQSEINDQGWSTAQMAYDTRQLLHYFRLMPDRRFLFGMRGGTRATPQAKIRMKRDIRRDFEAMFPAWRNVEAPHFWTGLACLSRDLTPYIGPIDGMANAYTALAYHGNGVAMGTYSGSLLADLVMGRPATHIPDIMRAPLRRFPLGTHRRWLLSAAYRWYGFRDKE